MLTHAISSTKPTAPCSMSSDGFMRADALLLQRHRIDTLAGVDSGMRLLQLLREDVQPRARLLDASRRRAAARTCGRPPSCATGWPGSAAAAATSRRRRCSTGVKPAGMTPMISWLSPLIAIDRPIDRAIGAEAPRPQRVAEDHHARRVRDVVGLRERAAQRRRRAGHVEVIVRRLLAEERLGHVAAGDARVPAADAGQALEDVGLRLPVEMLRRTRPLRRRPAVRAQVLPHDHQPVGIGIGQRPEQQRVDDA